MRTAGRVALVLALLAVALPAAANAQPPAAGSSAATGTTGARTMATTVASPSTDRDELVPPGILDEEPEGFRLDGNAAIALARTVPKVAEEIRDHPDAYPGVYIKGPDRWQVGWYLAGSPPEEIAQVTIDDASARVTEAWTGHQVAWTMARGYPGAFGRKVNSPWVWVTLTVLFIAPFLCRPVRMLHADLAVLAAFGVSVAFFNDAQIDVSVPLAYPLLVYLLLRLLWIGTRSRPDRAPPGPPPTRPGPRRAGGLPLLVPVTWLAVAAVFLLGFRVGLNVADSNVIDVGYAGVIGAQKLVDGEEIYGAFPEDNVHGDTYGPVVYAAYVPFELALPWSGEWDDLPAAHAAAIAFDVAALVLLFLLGRRLGGRDLGIVLAYAWCAFPFTLYALATNTNDTLVAAFVLAALLAGGPGRRGFLAVVGGLTKFASLALVPLLALHRAPDGRRSLPRFALGALAAVAVCAIPLLTSGDSLSAFVDRTVVYQAERGSPFSIWGLWDLDTLQRIWQVVAVLIAVGLAFVPRRRDLVGLAACAGAVLVALQLGVTHWFYLYVVWVFPLLALASLGREALGETVRAAGPPSLPGRECRSRPG